MFVFTFFSATSLGNSNIPSTFPFTVEVKTTSTLKYKHEVSSENDLSIPPGEYSLEFVGDHSWFYEVRIPGKNGIYQLSKAIAQEYFGRRKEFNVVKKSPPRNVVGNTYTPGSNDDWAWEYRDGNIVKSEQYFLDENDYFKVVDEKKLGEWEVYLIEVNGTPGKQWIIGKTTFEKLLDPQIVQKTINQQGSAIDSGKEQLKLEKVVRDMIFLSGNATSPKHFFRRSVQCISAELQKEERTSYGVEKHEGAQFNCHKYREHICAAIKKNSNLNSLAGYYMVKAVITQETGHKPYAMRYENRKMRNGWAGSVWLGKRGFQKFQNFLPTVYPAEFTSTGDLKGSIMDPEYMAYESSYGLMQVLTPTALGSKYLRGSGYVLGGEVEQVSPDEQYFHPELLLDPRINIMIGTEVLSAQYQAALRKDYKGNEAIRRAFAGYNGGRVENINDDAKEYMEEATILYDKYHDDCPFKTLKDVCGG